jgi:hypothetical protein
MRRQIRAAYNLEIRNGRAVVSPNSFSGMLFEYTEYTWHHYAKLSYAIVL